MKRSIKLRLIICSLVLFVAALGVNVFLNSSSVDKMYEESTIAQYLAIGENLKRKLVGPLNAGTSIDEVENIGQLLARTKESIIQCNREEPVRLNFFKKARNRGLVENLKKSCLRIFHSWQRILGIGGDKGSSPNSGSAMGSNTTGMRSSSDPGYSVSVAVPNNIVAYSTSLSIMSNGLPPDAITPWQTLENNENRNEKATEIRQIKKDASYFLAIPLRDKEQNLKAQIVLTIPENSVKSHKNVLIKVNITPLLLILCSGILLLVVTLNHMTKYQSDRRFYSKTRISVMVFFVICSAQIAFSGFTAITFKDLYLKMNKEKARMSVDLFKEDIESFLSEGNRIDDLSNQQVLLSEIISRSPDLNDITLFNRKWHPLFIVTQKDAIDCRKATYAQLNNMKTSLPKWDPRYNVRLHIKQGEEIEGYISTNISKSKLFDRLIEILLDSITVLVISILFLVEMMILSFNIIEKRANVEVPQTADDQTVRKTVSPPQYYGLMRPAAFLFLFGIDISISFLPLHMETLYVPILGLSRDTIMGLPISVEFFFIGLSILISGAWVDRQGWFRPFLVGLLLAGTGLLYSWLAPNGLHFIFSRAIVGSGYGLTLMASLGFVINYSDWKRKAQALANLSAGIYAGSICGGAAGAMVAERFGYNAVFLGGAVILFSVIFYAVIFMRAPIKSSSGQKVEKQKEKPKVKEIFRFITDRTVLSLVFFSSLPAAVAVVGFLNYFSPIYLNRIGVSQSTIGQILMLYGICLIYLGPFISRYMDASKSKRIFIFLGGVLGSLAFLIFHILDGVVAAIIAVLLLGLSSSFVLVSQSVYTLKLKVTQALGEGKAIGIFRSTSRIGQIGGPLVFSALIVATNINQNITYFGLAYLLSALLFMLFSQSEKEQEKKGKTYDLRCSVEKPSGNS